MKATKNIDPIKLVSDVCIALDASGPFRFIGRSGRNYAIRVALTKVSAEVIGPEAPFDNAPLPVVAADFDDEQIRKEVGAVIDYIEKRGYRAAEQIAEARRLLGNAGLN
jgi:hypothetical protein